MAAETGAIGGGGSARLGLGEGPHGAREPVDERLGGLQLSLDSPVAGRLVQPRSELVTAADGQRLHSQQIDARVIGAVAAGSPLELGLGGAQSRFGRGGERTLEGLVAAAVADRRAEPLELILRRVVEAAGDDQPVERELEVEAAYGSVADGDADVLLERGAHVEAGVVVGPEELRRSEV